MQFLKEIVLAIAFFFVMFFGLTGIFDVFGSAGPWHWPSGILLAVTIVYMLTVSILFKAARAGIKK